MLFGVDHHAQDRRPESIGQRNITAQPVGADAARADLERDTRVRGLPAQSRLLGVAQGMQWQVVSVLHQAQAKVGRPLQELKLIHRRGGLIMARHANRPGEPIRAEAEDGHSSAPDKVRTNGRSESGWPTYAQRWKVSVLLLTPERPPMVCPLHSISPKRCAPPNSPPSL
jgi:hypothetical protein